MTRIVLTPEQVAQINGGRAEFVDEAGNPLGRLFTDATYDRIASFLLPEPTPEDLAEARKEMLEHGGVPAEEVLARLRQVGRDSEARR